MEGDENLEVVHHHRARDEALVEEQALNVFREQLGGTHAQGREALSSGLRIGCVLHLIEKTEQGLSFDVEDRRRVCLAGDLVVALEEEVVQVLDRLLAGPIACSIEYLEDVLSSAVVARVFRVPEAVGETM